MNSALGVKGGNDFRLLHHTSEEPETNEKLEWVMVPNNLFLADAHCILRGVNEHQEQDNLAIWATHQVFFYGLFSSYIMLFCNLGVVWLSNLVHLHKCQLWGDEGSIVLYFVGQYCIFPTRFIISNTFCFSDICGVLFPTILDFVHCHSALKTLSLLGLAWVPCINIGLGYYTQLLFSHIEECKMRGVMGWWRYLNTNVKRLNT